MFFLKFVLATVLPLFLMGQAFANAPEARILEKSASSDQAWQAYLGKLAELPLEIDGQLVKGYDPETGLVFNFAVVQRVCFNTAEPWKSACPKKLGDRYVSVAARNGWTGPFIHESELRKQAAPSGPGVYFTFEALAPLATPVAAASAPALQVTPAPAVVVAAPAAPTISADELAKIARQAGQAAAKDEASRQEATIGILNRRTEELQQQLAGKSATEVALRKEVQALRRENSAAASAKQAELEAVQRAMDELHQQLAKVPTPEEAEEFARAAAEGLVAPLNTEVARLERQDKWLGGGLVAAIVIAGIALFGTAVVIGVSRLVSSRLKKHEKATATEFERVEREMRAVAADADAAVGISTRANQLGLTNNQRIASVQLTQLDHGRQLEAAGHVLGANLKWTIATAEAEAIDQTISSLKVGERSGAHEVTLPNTVVTLEFERVEDDRIIVHGLMPPQGQPVVSLRGSDVLGAIRKAYYQKRLPGIKVPALFQVASPPKLVKVAA
jgi:hypothetical protein